MLLELDAGILLVHSLEKWCDEEIKFSGICALDSPRAMPGSALHLLGRARRKIASKLRLPR